MYKGKMTTKVETLFFISMYTLEDLLNDDNLNVLEILRFEKHTDGYKIIYLVEK